MMRNLHPKGKAAAGCVNSNFFLTVSIPNVSSSFAEIFSAHVTN